MAHTTTIIGPETTIQGAVTGQGPLSVEGAVHGQITLEHDLTIADTGSVHGEVRVREAIVHGHLEGTLVATERLILSPSARVTGHIEAPLIRIDDGAHFSGEIEMELEGAAPAAAPARQAFTTPTRSSAAAPARQTSSPAVTTPRAVTSAAAPPRASSPQAAPQASTTVVVEEDVEEELEDVAEQEQEGLEENATPSTLDPAILAEYDDQTVKELREELRRRDLPVSGTKQELIERLVEDTSP